MIRYVLCFLLFTGAAMAKDGTIRSPNPAAPIDEEEAFWNTEEGQDITRLFDEFSSGKKSYDEVFDEYNKKWADKPLPNAPAQVPTAPYNPIR